jgi:hypothetical protein
MIGVIGKNTQIAQKNVAEERKPDWGNATIQSQKIAENFVMETTLKVWTATKLTVQQVMAFWLTHTTIYLQIRINF